MNSGPSDTFLALKTISLSDELSGTEKRVAAAILDHFNRKTGQCDPSLGSIAALLGLHRRTIMRAIKSLVHKGFLRKVKHGGHFHRNQYEPLWARFRAGEAGWNGRRQQMRKNREATKVSPSKGQSCHLGGDDDVTQTSLTNSTCSTSASRSSVNLPRASSTLRYRKGSAEKGNATALPLPGRSFVNRVLVKQKDAASASAERRWNAELVRQYANVPEVFASVIDAIDQELSATATELELRTPGTGFNFIIGELQSKLRLGADTKR